MFSLTQILLLSASVAEASGATWKIAISSFFLLLCFALVLLVLVKIIRLIATGRTRPLADTPGAQRQPPPSPPPQDPTRQEPARQTVASTTASGEPPAEYGPGTKLRSLRLTMSAPAFLVPMAIALLIAMVVAATTSTTVVPSENPFGIDMAWRFDNMTFGKWAGRHWENLLILGLIAVCLAGHVGLLRAAYANRAPTSADFLQGIKDHTFTFILGKLLLCLGVIAVSGMIGYRVSWAGILFVVPSLLLAPLLGTAALYPRQPIQAIKAALSHSTSDVHGTGKLVTIQILMLLGAWIIYGAVRSYPYVPHAWQLKSGSMLQIPLLANGSSTLSFNTFPMIPMFRGDPGEIAVIGFTVVCSTVFLGCHFLKVMDTVREQAEEAAATTAGQAA
ncbi:MAG: hypothetical protein ACYTGW_12755 [Planctomycetota bacterium]|jgi:hypothetical protein